MSFHRIICIGKIDQCHIGQRGAFSCFCWNDCILKFSAGAEIEKKIKPHSMKAKIKTEHSFIFCEITFFMSVADSEILL